MSVIIWCKIAESFIDGRILDRKRFRGRFCDALVADFYLDKIHDRVRN